VDKWPEPGDLLPVEVDPDDHGEVEVLWDEIPTTRDAAAPEAEQLAAHLRQQQAAGGSYPAAPGPGERGRPHPRRSRRRTGRSPEALIRIDRSARSPASPSALARCREVGPPALATPALVNGLNAARVDGSRCQRPSAETGGAPTVVTMAPAAMEAGRAPAAALPSGTPSGDGERVEVAMADHGDTPSLCNGCGSELRPGLVFCTACGTTVERRRSPTPDYDGAPPDGPVPPSATAPQPPPTWAPTPPSATAPQPPPAWAPTPPSAKGLPPGIGGSATAARAWGAVSLLFGALVLVGSAVPWFGGSSFALTDDMRSAWPLVVTGLVAVVGGIDGLRGSLAGPALAAGAGTVFILLQTVMLRLLSQVSPGAEIGGGGIAWTLGALAALVLLIAVLARLARDRAEGVAPGWLSGLVLAGGAVWLVGMVMPVVPGVTLGDHVRYGLFGGDTFSDVMTVAFIGIPAALVVVAAVARSGVAYGLAAGCMAFWTVAAVTSAAGYASSGDGSIRYTFGRVWPVMLGALGVAVAGCVAVLVAGWAPKGMRRASGSRAVLPIAPLVGLVLLPIVGVVGVVQEVEDDAISYAGDIDAEDDVYSPDDGAYDDGGDGDATDGGGSLDVVCTDLVDSAIESAWQDVDGAIHVIILVNNDCEIGQRLDDPSASFTLTNGGANVADATFDFSTDPVVVPAFGSSTAEIVFGPESFVDLEALETLGLGDQSTAGAGSLGFTYSYTCTDAPDATTSSSVVEVAGHATGTPLAPSTTTEDDALARLGEISAADQPFVESGVIERWVPQISSKKPNVVLPNGTVWDALSILDDHRSWRERFPRVRLLWSGDYTTFEATDFWVTIVAIPFDSPEAANGWCDAQGLPLEDCFAKLVSHTQSHEGSTRLR